MDAVQMLEKLRKHVGKRIDINIIKDLFSDYEEMGHTVDDLRIDIEGDYTTLDREKELFVVGLDAPDSYLFKLISKGGKLDAVEIYYTPLEDLKKREFIISQLIDNEVMTTTQKLINYYVIQYGSISRAELIYLLKEYTKRRNKNE